VDQVPKQARASNLQQVRLDIEIAAGGKPRAKCFGNSPEGWRQLMAWLKEQKIKRVHACLEATGRYSLGIALALSEAGHIASIVNPGQIQNLAR
jgi:transposase